MDRNQDLTEEEKKTLYGYPDAEEEQKEKAEEPASDK